jgi:ubiquinone/menaquinone biosynthesis C-methylase UbiE
MKIDAYSPDLLKVLACPVSVTDLTLEGTTLVSKVGFRYAEGDFRYTWSALPDKKWAEGQAHYVKFDQQWMSQDEKFYEAVDNEAVQVFGRFPLAGYVLDVGGGFGSAAYQAGVTPDRYISVDPMVRLWKDIPSETAFARHYQKISRHPRVPGFAEDLPIKNSIIDTILMRSCLDHFMNPHRALLEARRVLKPDGQLIVALSLDGAYKLGESTLRNRIKGFLKRSIIGDVYEYFFDPHMFHPTHKSLHDLIEGAGFTIAEEFMHSDYHNVICLRAVPKT